MAFCLGKECAHLDDKTNTCTFAGNCIVKKYNLNEQLNVKPVVATKPVEKTEKTAEQVVFNPFQRGNGCLFSGVKLEDILAYTR